MKRLSLGIAVLVCFSEAGLAQESPIECSDEARVLAESGPIVVEKHGQIIENLRITSVAGDAIYVNGFDDVVIRNVEIWHKGGHGIAAWGTKRLRIEDVSVTHAGAPPFGENPHHNQNNVTLVRSPNAMITRARLDKGSSNIYVHTSPNTVLRWIEGHDARGPMPRGQLVQFDSSSASLLEYFSSENPLDTSFTADNVSVYNSQDVNIRRGLIDGNNNSSGVGVICEDGCRNLNVEDVDTIRMGCGSFFAYPGHNVTFTRVRARDNFCEASNRRRADGTLDPHGGAPTSNALIFGASPNSTGIKFLDVKYHNPCNPNNIRWNMNAIEVFDGEQSDFETREPVRLQFCWQDVAAPSPPLAPNGFGVQ